MQGVPKVPESERVPRLDRHHWYDMTPYCCGIEMRKEKIAVTLDREFIGELDRLVGERVFQNRSQAIQQAVSMV